MTEPRDIIAIGGSAGAIESLGKLVSLLPAQLDAAIFVVIHTYPLGDSLLPAILTRRGSLSAAIATDGEPIVCDRIYVAPPDYHLMVERGRVRLSSGPKEGGHRPAIDPLFRRAAAAYRERVRGVILSGPPQRMPRRTFAAGWVTPTRTRTCWRRMRRASRPHSGPASGPWKNKRRSRTIWPARRRSEAIGSVPPASTIAPAGPASTPQECRRYCWPGRPSPLKPQTGPLRRPPSGGSRYGRLRSRPSPSTGPGM